jgi:hypothetical protein
VRRIVRGPVVQVNAVSLVPSETARTPSVMIPAPTRLDGLSPVHGTIGMAGSA